MLPAYVMLLVMLHQTALAALCGKRLGRAAHAPSLSLDGASHAVCLLLYLFRL